MAVATKKKSWNWFRNEDEDKRWPSRGAITPWHGSVPSLSQMQRDIEQVFADTFSNFRWPALVSMPGFFGTQAMFHPSLNITSSDSEYAITVETPGMEEKDIRLDVSRDGLLTISGEKRQESEDKSKDYECVECSYGAFQRSLSLPDDVDQEAIEARFKHGVLTITCPRAKMAQSKARQIPIGASKGGQDNIRATPANASPKKVA